MDTNVDLVNLSRYELNSIEIKVLRKGQRFYPSQDDVHFKVIKDIHLFAKKLLLKTLHEKNNFQSQ